MQIEIEVESDRPLVPLSLSPSTFIYSLTATAAAAVSDILSLTAPLCKHRSLRSVLSRAVSDTSTKYPRVQLLGHF